MISAPITQPTQSSFTSFGGQVQISGSFTEDQAKALATELNYGALPVKLDQQTVQTRVAVARQVVAAGRAHLGPHRPAGLVMIYTIFYYRLLGLVVVSGLAVTGALLWSIIACMGQTLNTTIDLAGVIGIIVSIGITVDSYIVYFERLKDEARSGRTVRTSVDRGFKSAFRTVLAADFVSLLGALVLYKFSIGPVQGFALFLGLSTVLDVFVTYFFTRPFVILLGRSRSATEAKGMGVASGLGRARGGGRMSPDTTTDGTTTVDGGRVDCRTPAEELERGVRARSSSTPPSSRRPRPRGRSGPTSSSASTGARRPSTSSATALVVRGLGRHHPPRHHLPVHPGAQRGHRLQGRPVVAGVVPDADRGPGHRRPPRRPA